MRAMALSSRPNFRPRDLARLDRVAHLALAPGQLRSAGLYLHKYHAPRRAITETVEHHEIHRTAEEPRILGIERETRQVGHELLEHLSGRDCLAALHRVRANRPRVPDAPDEKPEKGDDDADGQAGDQPERSDGRHTAH